MLISSWRRKMAQNTWIEKQIHKHTQRTSIALEDTRTQTASFPGKCMLFLSVFFSLLFFLYLDVGYPFCRHILPFPVRRRRRTSLHTMRRKNAGDSIENIHFVSLGSYSNTRIEWAHWNESLSVSLCVFSREKWTKKWRRRERGGGRDLLVNKCWLKLN